MNQPGLVDVQTVTSYIQFRFTQLRDGEGFALRFLNPTTKKAFSGVFTDAEKAIEAILQCSGQMHIWACVNPVFVDCMGEQKNIMRGGLAFGDGHVTRVCSLPIDVDAIRPSGEAANESELAEASKGYENIAAFLLSRGIDFTRIFSGNGYYAIVNTTDRAVDSVENTTVLEGLKTLFSSQGTKVDLAVSNPSRLMRVPGTLNLKGENSPERPRRMAQVLTTCVQVFDLSSLIGEMRSVQPILEVPKPFNQSEIGKSTSNYDGFAGDISTLNMVDLFKSVGLYVRPSSDAKHVVLCPNRESHTDNTDGETSTVIYQTGFAQSPGFKCMHDGCQHLNLSKVLNTYFTPEQVDAHCFQKFAAKKEDALQFPKHVDDFQLVHVSKLGEMSNVILEFVVERFLLKSSFSLVAAAPKVGKTTFLRWLAVCVARGQNFLGYPTKKGCVIYLALEEHVAGMWAEFEKMGVSEDDDLFIHAAPAPSDAIKKLEALIVKYKPILVIGDTMHKLVRYEEGNDYSKVNLALEPVLNLARKYKCCILLTHHTKKGDHSNGESILGSQAIHGSFDTTIFISRKGDNRVMTVEQRYQSICAEIDNEILNLDPFTNSLSLQSRGDFNAREVSDDILNLLKQCSVPMNKEEIRVALKKRPETILLSLNQLEQSGFIIAEKLPGRKAMHYSIATDAHVSDSSSIPVPPLKGIFSEDGLVKKMPLPPGIHLHESKTSDVHVPKSPSHKAEEQNNDGVEK